MSSTQNALFLNKITRPTLIFLYICFRASQEAQNIFGVDFDYGILRTVDEDGCEEEEEEEDEYLGEGQDVERRCCKLIMTDLFRCAK